MPQIEIVISPNGQSKVRTTGFTGAECRVASQFLESTLGEVASEQLTPEFHCVASQGISLQIETP